MTPTMTLHECCELMRANEIKISEAVLGQMIEEGKFPFAVGVRRKEGTYIIFRAGAVRWLEEMLGTQCAGKESE